MGWVQEGVAWSPTRWSVNQSCTPCSRITVCETGERLQPCVRRNNTQCVSCPVPTLHNYEYAEPGITCQTRCTQGYFLQNQDCVAVASLEPCALGKQWSHSALAPAERLTVPTCVPCPGNKSNLQYWSSGCVLLCNYNYYLHPTQGCVACNLTLCDVGTKATCTQNIQSCPFCNTSTFLSEIFDWRSNQEYTTRGTCAFACKPVSYCFICVCTCASFMNACGCDRRGTKNVLGICGAMRRRPPSLCLVPLRLGAPPCPNSLRPPGSWTTPQSRGSFSCFSYG